MLHDRPPTWNERTWLPTYPWLCEFDMQRAEDEAKMREEQRQKAAQQNVLLALMKTAQL